MSRLFLRPVLLAGLALSLSFSVSAAEKKPLLSGATTSMIVNTCAGCHGMKGVSNGPSIPTIAGNAPLYIVDMMEGYKNGEIPSTIMGRIAKGYSTAEIEQMAEYFSKQKFVSATGQLSDASVVDKGAKLHDKYCEKCHSENGMLQDDESGFLGGQWKAYLVGQLTDYTKGDRKPSKKMKKKLAKLVKKEGHEGVSALIEFYSTK